MHVLGSEGFSWGRLREFFPFGDFSLREGQYQELVLAVIDRLSTDEDRNLLMDLLDTQWCVYVEQLWVQQGHTARDQFAGEAHFAVARLQIHSNVRLQKGLQRRDARRAMLALDKRETLLDRIVTVAERTGV